MLAMAKASGVSAGRIKSDVSDSRKVQRVGNVVDSRFWNIFAMCPRVPPNEIDHSSGTFAATWDVESYICLLIRLLSARTCSEGNQGRSRLHAGNYMAYTVSYKPLHRE